MDYYTYIIKSSNLDKYYVGQTDFLIKRIQQHRSGLSTWTRQANDWKLVYFIIFESRNEAVSLEKKIKKRGVQRWLADNQLLMYLKLLE